MPVHNRAIIPGMLSDDARGLQLAVSEPSHKQPLRPGILVALIIVKIDKTSPVRVMNIGSSPRHFEREEELPYMEPVSSFVLLLRCD